MKFIGSSSHRLDKRSFEQCRQALLNDPAVSHWVKRAMAELDRRDPLDAAHDLDLLMTVFLRKLEGLMFGPMGESESMRISPVRGVPRTRM